VASLKSPTGLCSKIFGEAANYLCHSGRIALTGAKARYFTAKGGKIFPFIFLAVGECVIIVLAANNRGAKFSLVLWSGEIFLMT